MGKVLDFKRRTLETPTKKTTIKLSEILLRDPEFREDVKKIRALYKKTLLEMKGVYDVSPS